MIVEYSPALTEDDLIRRSGELHDEIQVWAPKLGDAVGDVVAKMVYATGKGTPPAWFLPHKRLLHINAAQIDIDKHPSVVTGALLHELGHAIHSHEELFSGWGIDPNVREVAILFEELRVELNLLIDISADDLRPMHSWLIGSMLSSRIPERKFELSKLWILIYGRVIVGAYSGEEAKEFDEIVRVVLGDHRVDMMRDILEEVVHVDFTLPITAARQMFDFAREWMELFEGDDENEDDDEKDFSAGVGGIVVCSHAPDCDADEGYPTDIPEDVYIVVDGSGEFSSIDAPESEAEPSEFSDLISKALSKMAEEVAKPLPVSERAVHTYDPAKALATLRSRSTKGSKESPPSPSLRVASQRLSDALRRMALPTVSRVRVAQEAPPGRLNGRGAVQRSADRAAGRISTARPWRGMKKSVTVAKPIRIGCMTDISGSMGWAEQVVAEFAWAVAKAGSSIGASTSAVTYGDYIHPVALPRETMKSVRRYPAVGGSEAFDKAAAAMEALLRLGEHDGASKVLFNVSDGNFVVRGEYERARTWLKRWTEAGTVVIWIGCSRSYKHHYDMPGVVFVESTNDVGKMISSLTTTLGNLK